MFEKVAQIECVPDSTTANEFAAQYRNTSPVLLKDLVAAQKDWSTASFEDPAVLREAIPDDDSRSVVHVSCITDGSASFDSLGTSKGSVEVKQLRWTEGIDLVLGNGHRSHSRYYLKSFMCPALRRYVGTFPDSLLFPTASDHHSINEEDTKVWVGTAQNVTPLHFDLCHGLIVQVVGRKRVTMFHPQNSKLLYPWRHGEGPPHRSQVTGDGFYTPQSPQEHTTQQCC